MREILFRGKRIDNGDFVFGMPWIFEDHACICPWDKGMCKYDTGYYPVPVIPETVGQYTGLTDKNGKRIFEGDIVKARQERNLDECRVGYENGAFVLYPQNGKIYERTLWEYWYNDWDVEVIGNIHDSPEKEKGRG